MSEFTPGQLSEIAALMDARLKQERHEADDHLDNALGVQKLKEINRGSGTPEAAVTGSVGDLFLRTNGGANTTLYVKESGTNTNTGWVAK